MSRALGGTSLTTREPMRISPLEIVSSPAIIRKSVDFPQPDGPTRTTNSPSATSIETPRTTSTAPKDLRTSRIANDAIVRSPVARGCWSLHCTEGEAFDDATTQEQSDDQDRRGRHRCRSRQRPPLGSVHVGEFADTD